MFWSVIPVNKLHLWSVKPEFGFTYLELQLHPGDNSPTDSHYRQLRNDLWNHFRKNGGSPMYSVTVGSKKQFYFKVLASAVKEVGIPDISKPIIEKTAKDPTELQERLAQKVARILGQTKEYYQSISTGHQRRENFDCLSYPELTTLQVDGVNVTLSRKEMIIGAAVGSGKTILSLVASKYLIDWSKNERVLVVTLKSVKEQWKEVADDEDMGRRVDVINYESLKNLIKFKTTAGGKKNRKEAYISQASKFFYLMNHNYKVIILDEVHKVRNITSDVGNVLKHFLQKTGIPYRICLTGTPLVNNPSDLLGILAASTNHPVGQLSLKEFNELLAHPKGEKTFKQLIKHSIWYRTLEDYHIPLPELDLEFIPIEPDQNFEDEYQKIIIKAQEIAIQGKDGSDMVINTAMQSIRVLSSRHKKPWIKAYLETYDSEQIVVMGSFNESLIYPLGRELELPTYTGQTDVKYREILKKRFISGELKTLLVNFGAGSTGLDGLQKVCGKMILANPVWEIGELIQAMARIRRLGGQPKAKILMPYITHKGDVVSIECAMIDSLRRKKEQFDYYLKNEDSPMDELSANLKQSEMAVRQQMYQAIYR